MHIHDIRTLLPLDRAAAAPLFRQLYAHIKDAILRGVLAPGAQLPPTRTLCAALGVSRQSVLNAYEQLSAEGYLDGTVGKGTFVSTRLPLSAPTTRLPLTLGARAPQGRMAGSQKAHARQLGLEAGTDAASSSPAAPALMRPLSARGQVYAGAMAGVRHHNEALRAFRVSMPGLDLFPFPLWSRLEARRWRRPDHNMGYGDPAGYLPLRELLCAYLGASRGVACTPDQVIITSGSQQALYLLSSLLLAPGDGVWIESPGYQGASAPMAAAGARLCTVPVTAEGMDVDYGVAHYPDARMVFATPSHQLPLGATMSLQRRLALLRWAGANKAWIIEDDYDSESRYTGPPLARACARCPSPPRAWTSTTAPPTIPTPAWSSPRPRTSCRWARP